MKKKELNLGKKLDRQEMRAVVGGTADYSCQCLNNYETFRCSDFGNCLSTADSKCGSSAPESYICG